jgi:hypothetical protein
VPDAADRGLVQSAGLAVERVDQWVASMGLLSRVRAMTASTGASLILRGWPRRGSSSRPSTPRATKRSRHLLTRLDVDSQLLRHCGAAMAFAQPQHDARAQSQRLGRGRPAHPLLQNHTGLVLPPEPAPSFLHDSSPVMLGVPTPKTYTVD